MGNGKNKGSSFERMICKRLSLWWTGGERSDVFWRTSNSGGRATFQNRRGDGTKRHCGDLCAIDPIGEPLLEKVIFELKKGYNRATIHDLLDKPEKSKPQIYEQWFEQAEEGRKNSGSSFWAVIHARDRREPLIFFPYGLAISLIFYPSNSFLALNLKEQKICACQFDIFLKEVDPTDFLFQGS